MGGDEGTAVEAVYAVLAAGDQPRLRLLLHPYLHWTGPDGVTVRGRTKVLSLLEIEPPPALTSVELRDGQSYRWQVE